MKRRKQYYRAPRRLARPDAKAAKTPRARGRREAAPPLSLWRLRTVACGAAFVLLVTLKLALPNGLAALRGTLGDWLVRDADFVSAFSAVGRAVSGEDGVLDALEDARVAVFGQTEAKEVAAPAKIAVPEEETEEEPEETRACPEHAVAERRELGFDYAAPVVGALTSGFGWRTHPMTGREAFHYGVDLAAEEGADVACFADGVVGVVAESVELGKYLTVHHGNGIVTLYAHLSRVTVGSGEQVRRGEKLAEAGSTGNATGAHLHFEIHDGQDYLDPGLYLS